MVKFVFRLLAFLVVLLIVLVGGLFLISGERLARIAGDQITNAVGREVTISDELRPQLFPNLGVRTGAFSVAGSEGSTAPLVTGAGLSVGVDLLGLFSRRVDVKEITLVSPTVTLVKDTNGRSNWDVAAGDAAPQSSASGGDGGTPELSLAALSIQDGTVSYRDEASGMDLRVENLDLTAAMPAPDAPLTASVAFTLNQQAASGSVELASLPRLLAGDLTGVTLDATIADNTVRFAGDLSSGGVVQGELAVALPAPAALMALNGGAPATLPPQILPIEVSGGLSVTPEAIVLTGGSYRLGANRLQGPVNVALQEVPFISADLSGETLDLSFLSAEEGSANAGDAPASAGEGWSTDPIDASGLSALNADIRLAASAIDLGTTALQNVTATVTVDRSRAVARIVEAQAFGGALNGQFVVNNRNGLSVAGEMDGKTVAVQALLTDMAGFDRMRGAGDTQLSFLGVGPSLDAIMKSLSGNASLAIGEGDITGFDLASLFGGGDAADAVGDRAVTIFEALNATFTIDQGVMRNDDLLIAANLFEATGKGDIDLGQQRMDYTIRPEVFENDLTGGLSVPVRIEGPWASLRIYPDLEAMARDRLKAEEDKLRAEAEARLEAERKELEERAERRLEKEKEKLEEKVGEEIRRGLRGLFD
ncbi:MAG: AsmA family protein [Paracoccaceae bacterium]